MNSSLLQVLNGFALRGIGSNASRKNNQNKWQELHSSQVQVKKHKQK
jgi:hypothetical protein